MSWFFTIFLLIYCGMHLLSYLRLRPLLPAGWRVRLILALAVVPLILAPIAVRMTDVWGCPGAAPYLAWPGYLWMGFIIVSFFLSLLLWLIELLLWVARVPGRPDASGPGFSCSWRWACASTGIGRRITSR